MDTLRLNVRGLIVDTLRLVKSLKRELFPVAVVFNPKKRYAGIVDVMGFESIGNMKDLFRFHNGTETNCRIARSLGIMLMNSNCFAIFITVAF